MSAVHLHLMLSHVPVIGVFGVALLLAVALLRRSEELTRVALVVGILLAVSAGIVYLTGEGSEDAVEHIAGVTGTTIEPHEEAGAVALWSSIGLGVFALGVLAVFRRRPIPRAATGGALALTLVVAGILAWTANLGGKIRHSEITGAAAADSAIPRGAGESRQ